MAADGRAISGRCERDLIDRLKNNQITTLANCHSRYTAFCICVFASIAVAAGNPRNSESTADFVTVCQLIAAPLEFDGKVVRLRHSRLQNRGFERTVVVEDRESGCGSVDTGVDDTGDEKTLRALFNALTQANAASTGATNYAVTADLVGRFSRHKPNGQPDQLHLRSASRIHIVQRPSVVPPFPGVGVRG